MTLIKAIKNTLDSLQMKALVPVYKVSELAI